MKANDWLDQAKAQLEHAGITTARLDSLVLLEDCLRQDRATILAHPDQELTTAQQAKLQRQVDRRCQHEPLSYIRGKTEFYGREFELNQYVLEPRPESEAMIDLLKQLKLPVAKIADIGTGSGALAVTAQLELPQSSVAAVDIDERCLTVATRNAAKYEVNIQLFHSDLLQSFLQKSCNFLPEVLLCNLPYVPDEYQINRAATHEPSLALFGGPDGLDLYRALFAQASQLTKRPIILTESLPPQHAALREIAAKSGYSQTAEEDFIQVFQAA